LRIYEGIGHDIVGDQIDALTEMVGTLRHTLRGAP
jgi:hypothetical protein